MLSEKAPHPVRINRQQFWTEQSPSQSQDSNPTCPDTMSLIYHLCRRHCQDYKPVLLFNESLLLTRSPTEATSKLLSVLFYHQDVFDHRHGIKILQVMFFIGWSWFLAKTDSVSSRFLFWNWNKRDRSQLIWSQSRQKWPKIVNLNHFFFIKKTLKIFFWQKNII